MFFECVSYLLRISLLGFVIGRIIPDSWFDSGAFPYKAFEFEKGGKVYDKFKIKSWKKKLPDMSRIFKRIMPPKCIKGILRAEQFFIMVKETCVAEFAHCMLVVFGFRCMSIWDGIGGLAVSLLYMLGNIPFIMVQRYNRFRYEKTINRMGYDIITESDEKVSQNA